MLLCGLDLMFDLTVVTLTYKVLSRPYLRNLRCEKLILGRDIRWGDGSQCGLDLTFHLAIVTLILIILTGLYLRICKI